MHEGHKQAVRLHCRENMYEIITHPHTHNYTTTLPDPKTRHTQARTHTKAQSKQKVSYSFSTDSVIATYSNLSLPIYDNIINPTVYTYVTVGQVSNAEVPNCKEITKTNLQTIL